MMVDVEERNVSEAGQLCEMAQADCIRAIQRDDGVETLVYLTDNRLGSSQVVKSIGDGIYTGQDGIVASLAQCTPQCRQTPDGIAIGR